MSYKRRFHIMSKVRDEGGPWYDGKLTDTFYSVQQVVADREAAEKLARKKLRHESRKLAKSKA